MREIMPEENSSTETPAAGAQPSMEVGSTVKNFVEDFINQAEQGLNSKGFVSCSESNCHVKIELNATESAEVGGGFKAHVLSLGGKKSDLNAQKMTIYARKADTEIEEAEKKAKIAEAEAQRTDAEAKKKIVEDAKAPLDLLRK